MEMRSQEKTKLYQNSRKMNMAENDKKLVTLKENKFISFKRKQEIDLENLI